MKRVIVRVRENESIWNADFDSVRVDEGKIYCSRAIEGENKPYWIDCAIKYGFDVDFSDDNLDVIVSIDIFFVKSISNVEP